MSVCLLTFESKWDYSGTESRGAVPKLGEKIQNRGCVFTFSVKLEKSEVISRRRFAVNGGDGQNTDPHSMDSPNGLPKWIMLPLKWTTPKNNLNEYYLKCYYDENHIFSIEAILRHKKVACMRRKMLFTIFKLQISLVMTSYTRPSFDQISNMMKKDISANLYHKCFILRSKILLNVLYNLGLTILFPWQHTGFQTSPILKVFLATLCVQFSYLQIMPDIHDPTSI